jgi:NADH-quinone oxidoreductase subunit L
MVKAGVFLAAVLLPFLLRFGMGPLMVVLGLASVVIASVNAMASTQIKRILAYSTIEDMGLMFIALGFGSIAAAAALFAFQTFYKGLVFMNAGEIMRANNGEEDIRKLAGPRKLSMLIPMIVAAASLAGIFPLGGFFGKLAVESAVNNYAVYAVLLAAELLSSMYIFRWLFTPLAGDKSKAKADYRMPPSMVAAIYILVVAILASSLFWIYYRSYIPTVVIGYLGAVVYTAIVLVGLLLSYLLYYRRVLPNPKLRSALSRIFDFGLLVNSFYRLVTYAVAGLGHLIDVFDYNAYLVIKGSGSGLGRISAALGRSESGSINYYLAAFVIGAMIAIVAFSVI